MFLICVSNGPRLRQSHIPTKGRSVAVRSAASNRLTWGCQSTRGNERTLMLQGEPGSSPAYALSPSLCRGIIRGVFPKCEC